MKAVVVYESLWGNTAAVARAIGEGLGPDVPVLATDEVAPELVGQADLVVAGAPVIGFNLATDAIRSNIAKDEADAPTPPDLSHPSLRSWLETLPEGHGRSAAFETRIWWSPRGATSSINARMKRAGYRPIAKGQKFIVTGKYGPLREGELERAREWGKDLAVSMADEAR